METKKRCLSKQFLLFGGGGGERSVWLLIMQYCNYFLLIVYTVYIRLNKTQGICHQNIAVHIDVYRTTQLYLQSLRIKRILWQ